MPYNDFAMKTWNIIEGILRNRTLLRDSPFYVLIFFSLFKINTIPTSEDRSSHLLKLVTTFCDKKIFEDLSETTVFLRLNWKIASSQVLSCFYYFCLNIPNQKTNARFKKSNKQKFHVSQKSNKQFALKMGIKKMKWVGI